GVVMYEMLTGERPFQGSGIVETNYAVLHDPPRPLSARIAAAAQAAVGRCLAKDPRERYQTAAEVDAALGAAEAAVLSGKWRRPDMGTAWRRFRIHAIWLAIALAAAALVWQRRPA